MLHTVQVSLLIDVENDAEAADAVNEILREQTVKFADHSCLIDYAQDGAIDTGKELTTDYEEGEFTTWTA